MATVPPWQAYSVVCPACNAQVHYPCTQATDTGRRDVTWVHLAREDASTTILITTTANPGITGTTTTTGA